MEGAFNQWLRGRVPAGNDSVIRGRALIAPGKHHLLLKRSRTRYCLKIKDGLLCAVTIAQDKATCVVFGLPREAIKLNGVDKILPLLLIDSAVLNCAKLATAERR